MVSLAKMQYVMIYVIITIMKKENIKRRKEDETAAFILGNLGLDWPDLEGKSVLDLGAADARLARPGRRRNMHIVSVDNHIEHLNKYWRHKIPKDVPYVLADARSLPFPDESFDLVTAHASVPLILVRTRDDVQTILSENYRVLKHDGEFRFGCGYSSTLPTNILNGSEEPMILRMDIFNPEDKKIPYEQQRTLEFLRTLFPNIEQHQPSRRKYNIQRYYVLRKPPQEKQ